MCSFSFKAIQSDFVKRHLIALGDNSNDDVLGFDSRLFLSADIILPILLKFFNVSI